MFLSVFLYEIYLPDINNLKDKRKIINSVFAQIKNRYNVSVTELDYQDSWQRSLIGISYLCLNRRNVDSTFDSILHFMVNERALNIIKQEKVVY